MVVLHSTQEVEAIIPFKITGIEIIGVKTQTEVDLSVEDEAFLEQVFHVFLDLDLAVGQMQEDWCATDVEGLDIQPAHAISM